MKLPHQQSHMQTRCHHTVGVDGCKSYGILAPVQSAVHYRVFSAPALPHLAQDRRRHSYLIALLYAHELDSLTTVAHEAGCAANIVMHRVAMLRPVASCTQRMYPNAMAQPLGDALSKCVPRPGALPAQLHGRGQALSARTGWLCVTTHGPKYHHLICSWATLFACRPADPASTRHLR
jgi:hypothetical protein